MLKNITKSRDIIQYIPAIDARDFPRTKKFEDYCDDQEIWTHYETGIYRIEDDGNVFAEWLKSIGVDFEDKNYIHVGVWGT